MKNRSQHKNTTVVSNDPDIKDTDTLITYERDDGYPTEQQLNIIKKIVPQVDFSSSESLF